jgi:hypothetical protein
VKNSVVRLATGLDLGLMVALVDRYNFFLMATVMLQAIERKKQLEEQVLALKFEEVCLRNQNQLSHADLLESLMSPDFTSSMVSFFYLLAPVMRASSAGLSSSSRMLIYIANRSRVLLQISVLVSMFSSHPFFPP